MITRRVRSLVALALVATQIIFEAAGIYNAQTTAIVVGRTQKYIRIRPLSEEEIADAAQHARS